MISHAPDGLRVVEIALPLISSDDPNVRRRTYDILFELFKDRLILYLQRLQLHEKPSIRQDSRTALSYIRQWHPFEPHTTVSRLIHLECLGTFRVFVGTRELQPVDWNGLGSGRGGGLKAQSIQAYLSHCGAEGASEDELFRACWGHDIEYKKSNLARSRSHLYDVLEGNHRAWGYSSYITQRAERFFLLPELCSTDVEAFRRNWRRAMDLEAHGSPEERYAAYGAVINSYGGSYMQTVRKGWDWHADTADQLQSFYLSALEQRASYDYDRDAFAECYNACFHGLQIDPSDQLLTGHLLNLLARSARATEFARVFATYLEAAGLIPGTSEYHDDLVAQIYHNHWARYSQG